MKFFDNCSYRTQFSFLIIGFVLSLSISSYIYLKWLQDSLIESTLESQSAAISSLIAEDMAKLIFLSDPDILASVTFKLQSIDELKSAVLYDLNNMPVLKIQQKEHINDEHFLSETKTKIYFDGVQIGAATLQLYNHAFYLEQQKSDDLYSLFITIFIVIGLFLVYAFDKRFIFRLTQLSLGLKHVAEQQDFSLRLTEDRIDDIGKAKHNFNQLVELVENQTKNLIYQAHHDALTGLYNRNRLLEHLERMLLNRPDSGFHAVCYIDLDQFKVVNDICGHAAGDELLKKLSLELLNTVKTYNDVVFGRIGGDEFIVLIKNKSKGEIHAVIHEMQNAARHFTFSFLEREFQVGASVGCILFSHEETTVGELFSAADALCYQVKKTNRGDALVRYLNDDQLLDAQNEMNWVTRINGAFAQDQFKIYLQPIVDVHRDAEPWNHFEVLVRMHDNQEVISPFFFIPVAERYGLTKKLDAWIIEEVFSQLKSHPQFLESLELISINLSGLSIVDKTFKEKVKALFGQYDVPYDKICFEITETGVISDIEKAIGFIDGFKELGVIFSLDDFGSGMSSFGYLKNLAVDILKIDGQFVKDICHDPIMKEMVAAMIKIGHVSHKKVVAEHVEDKGTVELIKLMGADYIQGYYYSKPLPIAEFIMAEKVAFKSI